MLPGFAFAKEVYNEFESDNCSRMAAALAYYTIFSLAPLTALLLMLASLFYDPANVHGEMNHQLSILLTDNGAKLVQSMAANTNKNPVGLWGSLAGLAMLIYGASCGISELQGALNTVWKVRPGEEPHAARGYWFARLVSLGMIVLLAMLLLASIVFSTLLTAVGDRLPLLFPQAASQAMLQLMQGASSFAVVTILFAMVYKLLPDAPIRWQDVWVGAIFTGVLFVVGKFCLELYLAQRDLSTVYGAAGSFVGILLWINYAALIFLFGAESTQVWARHRKAKNMAYLG